MGVKCLLFILTIKRWLSNVSNVLSVEVIGDKICSPCFVCLSEGV